MQSVFLGSGRGGSRNSIRRKKNVAGEERKKESGGGEKQIYCVSVFFFSCYPFCIDNCHMILFDLANLETVISAIAFVK